ncbi:hypothetical protein [Indioceanicola profundi]|uniref:hypothetical protein n=1 Tax=Indioceanicola profundi TaxID=2220096 RepID=UPI000E6AB46B|nr:hypothetical protein [Indioceanicola profundi]
MLVNIAFLLIFLGCLAYLAVGLRRMESDMAGSRREAERLDRQRGELNGGIGTLLDMIGQEETKLAAILLERDRLADQKEEAEVQLQTALDVPKQRLFVFDKSTLIHGRLWEVTVANPDLTSTAGGGSPTAQEWAMGRICLVGSATERDARHRAESRFPSSQGYRIIKVERFRRS